LGRLAWSQLRFRAARTIALLAGVLLAATAFTVLTAASRTSQLRTVGTVSAHFSPAYDILVRPKGSRTALETRSGTVQPNFLSGIYGGISMAQYRQIQKIPGVQVAAPIAMVGYTLIRAGILVQLPAADNARPGRQLYRYTTTWVSAGGTTRVVQPSSYLYLTPDRLGLNNQGDTYEDLPGGSKVTVCSQSASQPASPFDVAAQSAGWCWSHIDANAGSFTVSPEPHQAFAVVNWSFPMLIAAVDPAAEAKLDGFSHAVTSGRYLAENAGGGHAADGQATFPVLAASASGIGEYAVTQVQRMPAPAAPVSLTAARMAGEAAVPGQNVLTVRTSAQQAYQQVLALTRSSQPVDDYLTAGPVSYQRAANGSLTPVQVRNPVSVWQPDQATSALLAPPMDETDSQYRSLGQHDQIGSQASGGPPEMQLVGVFDPAKVRAFDPLSQVPLGPFQSTAAAPANAATRNALGGGDLLPNLNLGGYESQPAQLITTLAALPVLDSSGAFSGNSHASDPISVIRVRVAGVTGPNPVSLERIREVAQQIAVGTGLDVDIVAGSSPEPVTINLPAGKYGQPALELSEGWVKKGVAVAILNAVDKKSVVLFALILVVCVLFVANSATAAVRGRRRELGVLACLGWTRPRLFAVVLGELAAIGLAAGVVGAVAALPLSAALGLHASLGRAALAVPVAMAVAVASGVVPAWLGARADPLASVRPPVLAVRRGHQTGGITALALVNTSRAPGRTMVAVFSLAVGVAGLTLLTAVTVAYRGVMVGSLLGDAVAVQVRGVDYVAVAATVLLGVLAVADVVFLNIRERAAELATIRSFGWRESSLIRLVVTEGAMIGVAGSVAGAALGLVLAGEFAGQLPPRLFAVAAVAAAAGVLVTAGAALLPAQLLRRLPTAHLLAEE
jgi:putative ABC transport system permease protein